MSARPVQISIDDALLSRIDSDPETQQQGRSAFVRAAVEVYLAAKERRAIDEQLIRAYSGQSEVMLDEVRELLVEVCSVPDLARRSGRGSIPTQNR